MYSDADKLRHDRVYEQDEAENLKCEIELVESRREIALAVKPLAQERFAYW